MCQFFGIQRYVWLRATINASSITVLRFGRAVFGCASGYAADVVVVFIDDMGWSDFSCFGNTEAETPAIDRLAREGIA